SRGHRIQIRRRRADRIAGEPSLGGRRGLGPVRLLPAESEREDGRALGPFSRLPALVQPGPRHSDARDNAYPCCGGAAMSRLPEGGRIDRSRPIRFTFNGHIHQGCAVDTLALALLATAVRIVARSVTYGRPRGVFSAGSEEPNALVQVGSETMLRATQVELVDGLEAASLNG